MSCKLKYVTEIVKNRLMTRWRSAILHNDSREFKNGEFDIEDKERSGRPKLYEDAELEALLDQDSC